MTQYHERFGVIVLGSAVALGAELPDVSLEHSQQVDEGFRLTPQTQSDE